MEAQKQMQFVWTKEYQGFSKASSELFKCQHATSRDAQVPQEEIALMFDKIELILY